MRNFFDDNAAPLKVETTIDCLVALTDMVTRGDNAEQKLRQELWGKGDEIDNLKYAHFKEREILGGEIEDLKAEIRQLSYLNNDHINERQRLYGENEKLLAELREYKRAPGKYSVRLESYGLNKIQCIKIVREYVRDTTYSPPFDKIGLKEAKELVESAPCMLSDNMNSIAASKLCQELDSVGARTSLDLRSDEENITEGEN